MNGHDEQVNVYAMRKRRNDESRSWATRNTEPWTDEEEQFLLDEWILVPVAARDEVVISQIVERTIESCRVRCEKIRKRLGIQVHEVTAIVVTDDYKGTHDAPDDQWWSPDYYTKEK